MISTILKYIGMFSLFDNIEQRYKPKVYFSAEKYLNLGRKAWKENNYLVTFNN